MKHHKSKSCIKFGIEKLAELNGSQTALEICARYPSHQSFPREPDGYSVDTSWFSGIRLSTGNHLILPTVCSGHNIILDNTVRVRQRRRAYQNDFWYTYRELWAHRSSTYGLPRDRKLVVRWVRMARSKKERGREKRSERGRGKNGRRKKNYRVDRNTHMQKARRGRGRSEGA